MVKGLGALEKRFQKIPQSVKDAAATAMEKEAQKITNEMRLLAERYRSGVMKASIGWTWGDAPRGTMRLKTVRGKGVKYGKVYITIYAGTAPSSEEGAFYALFVEKGHGGPRPAGPAPFFYPVWDSNRRYSNGNISRAITRAIKKL